MKISIMKTEISVTYSGVFVTVILLTASYIISSHLNRLFTSWRLGCKSPRTFPVFHSLQLFLGIRKRLQRHTVMPGQAQLHKTYGPTFQRVGFLRNTIHTIDPMNIRTVWATCFREWGVEAIRMETLGQFCGRGIATVDGHLWERSRDLVRPHFMGPNAAKIDLGIVEKYICKYIDKIPRDGKMIDLQPLIYDIYFETGYEFALGEPFDKLPGYENVSVQKVRGWLDYGVVGSRKRFVQGAMKHFEKDERWIEACNSMRTFTEAVIARARQLESPKHSEKEKFSTTSPNAIGKTTLISRMIAEFDDPIDLRSLVLQYFMGSSFTVSGTVTNASYLLSKHPEVWARLRQEVLSHQSMGFTVETLKTMPYLKKVLEESLRLFPLTTVEFRNALKDTILPTGGGADGRSPIYAPKGTTLITSVWALHRQEAVFGEDVHDFNPDRWDTHHPQRWDYVPFGGGPRICVGQEKARSESMYILARLAQKFATMTSGEGMLDSRTGQEMLGCKVQLDWVAAKTAP